MVRCVPKIPILPRNIVLSEYVHSTSDERNDLHPTMGANCRLQQFG